MAMVGKVLEMAAPLMLPRIPVVGQPLANAVLVGSAMKSANEQGENPVTAGLTTYSTNKFLYGTADAAIGAAASKLGLPNPAGLASMLAIQGAQLIGAASINDMQNTGKVMGQAFNQRGKFGSGHFEMTKAGYTMRQRSLNAIRQNGINVQSALGNEARNYMLA